MRQRPFATLIPPILIVIGTAFMLAACGSSERTVVVNPEPGQTVVVNPPR